MICSVLFNVLLFGLYWWGADRVWGNKHAKLNICCNSLWDTIESFSPLNTEYHLLYSASPTQSRLTWVCRGDKKERSECVAQKQKEDYRRIIMFFFSPQNKNVKKKEEYLRSPHMSSLACLIYHRTHLTPGELQVSRCGSK